MLMESRVDLKTFLELLRKMALQLSPQQLTQMGISLKT